MKKFFIIALALIVAVGFAADMAFAGDLSVSGTMRVRAWSIDDGTNEADYWDQRLRTAVTFTGAEGISGHLRLDFSEITWGDAGFTHRPSDATELQVDRAYLQVVQENYKIKAGQLFAGLGNTIAYDNNCTGLLVDIKNVLPVTLTLGVVKQAEGTTTADDDTDHLLANVAYATDAYSLNIFTAMQQDDGNDEPMLIGAQVKTTVADIALNAELDMFSGDDGAGKDYVGTQLYVNAEKKINDQLTAGLDVIYAAGTDDATETQMTTLNAAVFADWCIMDRGPFNADISLFDEMEPTANGGSMGAGVYADYAATEDLLVQASVLYLTIPEDAAAVDSVMVFNVGLSYDLAPNTTLAVQYNMADFDEPVTDPDAVTTMVARLQIKF